MEPGAMRACPVTEIVGGPSGDAAPALSFSEISERASANGHGYLVGWRRAASGGVAELNHDDKDQKMQWAPGDELLLLNLDE